MLCRNFSAEKARSDLYIARTSPVNDGREKAEVNSLEYFMRGHQRLKWRYSYVAATYKVLLVSSAGESLLCLLPRTNFTKFRKLARGSDVSFNVR